MSVRVTRDSRVKGLSNVAEVLLAKSEFGPLTACGAEAWTSGGIRQVSFAIVGHFFRSGEMAFCFLRQRFTRLQKGIWNRTTINLPVREETAWKFRWLDSPSRFGPASSTSLVVNAEG